MDLETWENTSMEAEHSKLLYDHSESYHAELHKSISNEDIEKQYCEKLDVMQLVECNVLDPPTGEEDATMALTIRETAP